MEYVIDINENVFTRLFDNGTEDYEISNNDLSAIAKAIRNGILLPKGHGALIDKKDIDANCITYHTDYDGSWCYRVFDIENNVPTIIPADKEGAEE